MWTKVARKRGRAGGARLPPSHVAVLVRDLTRGQRSAEEHERVHPAVARVPVGGALPGEAATDLDAARVGGRGDVRTGAVDQPRVVVAGVEAGHRFAVDVERHGAVGEVEGGGQ